MAARANAGTVGIVSGGVHGPHISIATNLAAVLDNGSRLGAVAVIGRGSVQNIAAIMVPWGVDLDIVQSYLLADVWRKRPFPSVDRLVQHVCRLDDEKVHILAAPGTERVQDLAGKTVSVGLRGSGKAMTARLIFDAPAIRVREENAAQHGRAGACALEAYLPRRLAGRASCRH